MTDTTDLDKIKRIWSQPVIPVIYRQAKGKPLSLKLPYHADNRVWLQNGGRTKPKWDKERKHWVLPYAWLNRLVESTLHRWGKLYIIQPYRVQEKCAPACWNAEGYECQCSCMGENHGMGDPGGKWFVVDDTFATKWGEQEYACRLLVKK